MQQTLQQLHHTDRVTARPPPAVGVVVDVRNKHVSLKGMHGYIKQVAAACFTHCGPGQCKHDLAAAGQET